MGVSSEIRGFLDLVAMVHGKLQQYGHFLTRENAVIKCQLTFDQGPNSTGFSETYYSNLADASAAMGALEKLAPIRALMLAQPWQIHYARVTLNVPPSKPGVRRQRQAILKSLEIPASSLGATITGQADVPIVAAKVRLSGNSGLVFRTMEMGGLPDSLWASAGDVPARAFFKVFLPGFVIALNAGGFCIAHRDPTQKLPQPIPITDGVFLAMTGRKRGRPFLAPRGHV